MRVTDVVTRARIQPSALRAYLAEGSGTFVLVFASCGAIVVNATTGELGHIGIAAAFALVFMVTVYAVGHISGAHLKPAVTAAFATVGLAALFGGLISGASMNPARSIGPALVSGDLGSLWTHIVGPVVGAVIGVAAYRVARIDGPGDANP